MNGVCREKESLSVKANELKAELVNVTVQRDELEKSNLETRSQVPNRLQCVEVFGLLYCIGSVK